MPDICTLGYHNCDPNAVCTVVGGTNTSCTCDEGYEGDGFTCFALTSPPLCLQGLTSCDANATCTIDSNTNAPVCVCDPGFTGDGRLCAPLEVCNETCLTIQADLHCIVLQQRIIECTSPGVQTLVDTVSHELVSVFK